MSEEDNKALYRRLFEEAINQGSLETVDELVSPNYVNYNFPAPTPGSDGFKQVIGMFRTAFPNIRVDVEQVFAEGDTVIGRGAFVGNHQGPFQGIPPTGKQVRVPYIDIWRIEGGKFVENWVQMDLLGLMQQLGVVPPPPSTPSGQEPVS